MDGPEQSVPSINHATMDRLSATLSLAIRGQDELRDSPARALVVNLSAQLSSFHNALANYHRVLPRWPGLKGRRRANVR